MIDEGFPNYCVITLLVFESQMYRMGLFSALIQKEKKLKPNDPATREAASQAKSHGHKSGWMRRGFAVAALPLAVLLAGATHIDRHRTPHKQPLCCFLIQLTSCFAKSGWLTLPECFSN